MARVNWTITSSFRSLPFLLPVCLPPLKTCAGRNEDRTIQSTLDLGWNLLGKVPPEELTRISPEIKKKYYKAKYEVQEEKKTEEIKEEVKEEKVE